MPWPRFFKVGLVLLDEGKLESVKYIIDQVPTYLKNVVLHKRPENKESVVGNFVVFQVGQYLRPVHPGERWHSEEVACGKYCCHDDAEAFTFVAHFLFAEECGAVVELDRIFTHL